MRGWGGLVRERGWSLGGWWSRRIMRDMRGSGKFRFYSFIGLFFRVKGVEVK